MTRILRFMPVADIHLGYQQYNSRERFKGFSHLFVISHDDTFERDTDHVVRVVKEDGVSRAGPVE